MKYRRLKTLGSNGHPTLRYYKLAENAEALTNAFYGLTDGIASKIEGAVGAGVQIIGFSHGGDNLAKGLIFLDINENVVYMGILEDGDDRPEIGDIVNGYQKVIDTHYDGDNDVYGKNDEDWGIETLDNPYYLFVIVQPEGTAYASAIDDSDAGEESGTAYPVNPKPAPTAPNKAVISVITEGGTGILKYQEIGGEAKTATLTQAGGETFTTVPVDEAGNALSTKYTSIAMYDDTGDNLVVDLASVTVTGIVEIKVAVPVVGP